MYYKVTIHETGKAFFSKDKYAMFGTETLSFATKEEVAKMLYERYGKCKRSKMYQGEGEHIGYVFHFINSDISHAPVETWAQQDWVTVTEVEEKPVIVRPVKTDKVSVA